jgi:hypothetical protein
MNRSIRVAILGSATLVLLGLAGCGENNEARVESGGVTPPGAASSSDAGLKVKLETTTKNPYSQGAGSGPKTAPVKKQQSAPDATPAPEKSS